MPTVQRILQEKGTSVRLVGPEATVYDAAVIMNEHRIGALMVQDGEGLPVGIITERDVLSRVVAAQKDPASTAVREVMTQKMLTCSPDTPIADARMLIKEKRVRHLPVIDDNGRLAGMVSIGDFNAWDLAGQKSQIEALEQYLYGQS